MSYQSGCNGKVILGKLPADVQRRLASLPGEWLEYDQKTGAIEIGHIQPSTGPILPTVTVELVRILSEIPYELQSRIEGGDFFVHTEEPATQLVRIRVEPGGSMNVQWAHPDYAGAAREPWSENVRIATPEWEHRLNGEVAFEADDAERSADALQTLADTFEGLYAEGDFRATAEGDTVTVTLNDVNLDGLLLAARLVDLARPGTLEGSYEIGSFADFVPENLVRLHFEGGDACVQHPLLWS
ncbi:MAG: hypothetical protein Q8W45_07320 [Candidatus Palauibacterales bacterium]|nr:hypothetical protein [Candidatus Palauibacterales bacterium]